MKELSSKISYKNRIERIRPDYLKVCKYLEFYSSFNDLDSEKFFDDVFIFSLDYIVEHGFHYDIEEFLPMRTPKGFKLSENTYTLFKNMHDHYNKIFLLKYGRKLLVCELVELILYIYSLKKIPDSEREKIPIEWGIKDLKK